MKLDRAEWAGNGAALALHLALVAALTMNLAKPATPPEPPAVFVEFVDEVGLESRAPAQASAEAQQAMTPEPVEELVPPPPEPEAIPEPRIEPTPAPAPRASEAVEPDRRVVRPRARPTGRLGDDLLDGVSEGNSRRGDALSAAPAAPAFDANAQASIVQAIRRQVQPCANRQIDPGPGANQIRVTLNLRLDRSGRLTRSPRVVGTSGVNADNERYEQRVKDLARAAYEGCAPLSGLPPELHSTPQGGWGNINMTYRLP